MIAARPRGRATVLAVAAVTLAVLAAAIWLTAASGPCLRHEHMGAHACERDR